MADGSFTCAGVGQGGHPRPYDDTNINARTVIPSSSLVSSMQHPSRELYTWAKDERRHATQPHARNARVSQCKRHVEHVFLILARLGYQVVVFVVDVHMAR